MKRTLMLGLLFTALLTLAPAPEPAEAIGGLCWHCVEHEWEFPDGTSEVLSFCLYLGGDGATDCWETTGYTGCVLWFPGGCSGSEPPKE